MNRIVLLTHSGLGRGFLSVLEHIYGAVPDAVELREIGADSDLEWEKAQLRQRIGQLAPGEALLILTDLFGATPTNIVPVEMLGARARMVTGVNLPMLLRALSRRDMPVQPWLDAVLAGAHEGIRAFPHKRGNFPS
ncbi:MULTISPECIES: PTS sugar transporter subunit IIA [Acidithiobacillus]|uniref:PTS system fructose subfamily IIA component n=3 Tax=Acidithiobacillus caldus TaxID=33059 RepID=F9ZSR2_ACICS|nr:MULTISPECIES: PTS fructose transporter subunit IIA [Acidithiobacillus]AEK57028.1 PTS system fructose subfamily IIA component [Acidithiobacillus caldus SM-1]AIA54294.1 PTS system permease (IIAMan), nitrogen regulatory IIA protein [Acidithiobacillus caldus ATCC 51756]AUW31818.1 PTS fructose transporter subunit IIA [Acidithiobacillus caldus]MBU2728869.1 PTS fructose transporter subunit IIA [Acidithiobacillus caldus]MBU2734666.1 PTS fructose transporter subunit IIA [Acidithiobacillus caldus ATC